MTKFELISQICNFNYNTQIPSELALQKFMLGEYRFWGVCFWACKYPKNLFGLLLTYQGYRNSLQKKNLQTRVKWPFSVFFFPQGYFNL